MPYPVFQAGMTLTAGLLSAMQPIERTMTVDQNSPNTNFLDLTELAIPLAANARYDILLVLGVTGSSTGDLKTQWTFPAGTSGLKAAWGGPITMTDRLDTNVRVGVHALNTVVTYGLTSTTSGASCIERGMITTGGTPGNWVPQFAQNTLDAANPTRIFGSSYAIVRRHS